MKKWIDENPKPDGSKYNIYADGLKIYTTIDSRMQTYAEEAVKNHMKNLQKAFFEENNVEIAQYNFLTRDKIDIYSTNKDNYKELLFIPNFIFNRDIKVHDFDELLD